MIKLIKKNDGINNQKLILFNLGNAISGAPTNIGITKLPKPPINAGITIKKIITNACAVIITLKTWWFPSRTAKAISLNSILISTESIVPISPAKNAKIKYKLPISLWLVENTQRRNIYPIFFLLCLFIRF